jgi:hypothetical protein
VKHNLTECDNSAAQILINYFREQIEEADASREYDQVKLYNYLLGIAQRVREEAGK